MMVATYAICSTIVAYAGRAVEVVDLASCRFDASWGQQPSSPNVGEDVVKLLSIVARADHTDMAGNLSSPTKRVIERLPIGAQYCVWGGLARLNSNRIVYKKPFKDG
jgi:hypothetical protein